MTIVYFVLLIGVLIFVHELGHFLFAKLFGVKVLKFSLGFGPRAVGYKWGETEYVIAWLPLGGFVKMLGEDPHDQIAPGEEDRAFQRKPIWQRTLIILAGPVFNLIFPLLISFFTFIGQDALYPAVIGRVFVGQPAAEAGLLPGDQIAAVDQHPVRYWSELQRFISEHPGEPLRVEIKRGERVLVRQITPKEHTIPNRLGMVEKVGLIGISPYFDAAQLGIDDPNSPAARAGLRTGDIVVLANDQPIDRWSQFEKLATDCSNETLRLFFVRPIAFENKFIDLHRLSPQVVTIRRGKTRSDLASDCDIGFHSAEMFISRVTPNSVAAKLGLSPGDRINTFDGQTLTQWDLLSLALMSKDGREAEHHLSWTTAAGERKEGTFTLEPSTFVDEYMQQHEQYEFGAYNRTIERKADLVAVENRVAFAAAASVRQVGQIISVTAIAVAQLLQGGISAENIGGPIIIAHTARVAAEKGWDHFLWIMALISVNLAIFNLLPIPILDGGHLVFLGAEAIRRKPVSLRVREIASLIGLTLLLALMVFAFKNDVVRLWLR